MINIIDKVGAIILQDKKMLVVREKNVDAFFIPGGKRDNNESDEEVLRRELMEETNLSVKPIKYYKEFITKAQLENDNVKVATYFCNAEGVAKPGKEIEEILWIDKNTNVNLGNVLKLMLPELIKNGYL